jgi:hypothetical protein
MPRVLLVVGSVSPCRYNDVDARDIEVVTVRRRLFATKVIWARS